MEFNITDHLTKEEISNICERAVEDAATNAITKMLRDEPDLERILTNVAYQTVWKKVDESFPEDAEKFITEKIPEVINDLAPWQVFRPRESWMPGPSAGYAMLTRALEASEGMIVNRVHELIASIDLYAIKDIVDEMIYEAIAKLGQKEGTP